MSVDIDYWMQASCTKKFETMGDIQISGDIPSMAVDVLEELGKFIENDNGIYEITITIKRGSKV